MPSLELGSFCPEDHLPALLVQIFVSKTNAWKVLHSRILLQNARSFIFFVSYKKLWAFNPGKSFSAIRSASLRQRAECVKILV